MRWLSSGLLAAFCLGGCFDYRAGRDALAVTVWEQRGEAVGDQVYVYCSRAAHRERLMFLWGLQRTVGTHRVVITCSPALFIVPSDDDKEVH